MTNAIAFRYKYAELKKAQGFCADRAMQAIQNECKGLSEAQNEIFRAHVNDICASVFCSVIKQYDPIVQEDVIEPVDIKAAQRVSRLQAEIRLRRERLALLKKNVLKMVQIRMEDALESGRKCSIDQVEGNANENECALLECSFDLNAIQESFTNMTQVSQSISDVVDELNAVTQMVEQAIKRPRTFIDKALATSPPKLSAAHQQESTEDTTDTPPALWSCIL